MFMENDKEFPKSLFEATRYFADLMCAWTSSLQCAGRMGSPARTAMASGSLTCHRRIWKCMAKECHKQFSVKTHSVFEDSPFRSISGSPPFGWW